MGDKFLVDDRVQAMVLRISFLKMHASHLWRKQLSNTERLYLPIDADGPALRLQGLKMAQRLPQGDMLIGDGLRLLLGKAGLLLKLFPPRGRLCALFHIFG